MAVNFSSLLNQNAGDAKRPPLLPEGTYYARIIGHEVTESSQKKTPGIIIKAKFSHAHEDVNLVDENGEPIDITGKDIPKRGSTFWMSENAQFMLADFIKGILKLDSLEGMAWSILLPQLVGQDMQLEIVHTTFEQNGETQFVAEVGRMSAVPA